MPLLITVMWGVMHCSLVSMLWNFRRICLHHKSQCILPHPDDGCTGFLWNINICPPDSMVSHPRRQLLSSGTCFTICSAHKFICILGFIRFDFFILVIIRITVFWDWFRAVWYIGAIVFEECATSNCREEAGGSRVIGNDGTVSTVPHSVMAKNTDILNYSLMFYFWLTLVLPGCTVICETLILVKKKVYVYNTKRKSVILALFWQLDWYTWITCNKKTKCQRSAANHRSSNRTYPFGSFAYSASKVNLILCIFVVSFWNVVPFKDEM